jgi:hypothetical protein
MKDDRAQQLQQQQQQQRTCPYQIIAVIQVSAAILQRHGDTHHHQTPLSDIDGLPCHDEDSWHTVATPTTDHDASWSSNDGL